MMGLNALFRLLWRPVSLGLLFPLGLIAALFLLVYPPDPHVHPHPPLPPGNLNVFALVFSGVAGLYVGSVVFELQNTLLSWILPALRRKLLSSLLLVGITTAIIVTWLCKLFEGPAPWMAVFTSGLLWYSMGLGLSTMRFLDVRIRNIRLCGAATLTLVLLVAAGFVINRFSDIYITQPVLCVVLTMLGVSIYLYRILEVKTFRRSPLVSIQEMLVSKGNTTRIWNRVAPLTRLFDWIRAGEFENLGFNRGGWPAKAVVQSCIVVVGGAALDFLMDGISLAFFVTYVFSSSLTACMFLQKGWHYPLSRNQMARLAFCSSFLSNAVSCGILLLTFLSYEVLIGRYAGFDFYRLLTLTFIFAPSCHWARLRHGLDFLNLPNSRPFTLKGILTYSGGLICYGVMSAIWLRAAPDVPDHYEFGAFAGLILLSQFLFRYKVNRYFKFGDLV